MKFKTIVLIGIFSSVSLFASESENLQQYVEKTEFLIEQANRKIFNIKRDVKQIQFRLKIEESIVLKNETTQDELSAACLCIEKAIESMFEFLRNYYLLSSIAEAVLKKNQEYLNDQKNFSVFLPRDEEINLILSMFQSTKTVINLVQAATQKVQVIQEMYRETIDCLNGKSSQKKLAEKNKVLKTSSLNVNEERYIRLRMQLEKNLEYYFDESVRAEVALGLNKDGQYQSNVKPYFLKEDMSSEVDKHAHEPMSLAPFQLKEFIPVPLESDEDMARRLQDEENALFAQ